MSATDSKFNEKRFETLTDDDIVTERKLPRRSFLNSSGALLAGIVGMVSGARSSAQEADPNKRPEDQPKPDDKRKPDDRRKADDKRKTEDRPKPDDKRKPEDPDKPGEPHR